MTLPPIRQQLLIAAILSAALVLAGMQTFRLARNVLQQLNALSVTNTDNVQWNLIQSEVELFQLELAVIAPQKAPGEQAARVRQRFDIFYSRVDTFRESPLYVRLLEASGSSEHLSRMVGFLDRWVPVIDGPDAGLNSQLEAMEADIQRLHGDVRAFVLLAMRNHAAQSDQRRRQISVTLVSLGASTLGLVATLIAGVVLLWRMYRRLRRVSRDSDMVRARLEAIVTSSLDAILVVGQNGAIVDFNAAAKKLFGAERRELRGQPVATFLQMEQVEDGASSMVSRLTKAARSLKANSRLQLRGKRISGVAFPAELSLSVALSGQEELLVAFVRDISDRLNAENELRQARDTALAGEQAKSNLLTVMSHEMRTPLNGVLGALDLLEAQDLTKAQSRFVDAIRVSGDLLLHHVNDVLELSRLESGRAGANRAGFDLQALAGSLVDSQQAVARQRGVDLSVTCRLGETPMVEGDQRLIQKSLLNLVGNALKFTRAGSVSVELERLGNGPEVEVRVTDTGQGIAPQDLERIFDAFVTIDTSYSRASEGTGLGLAITRRMIEAMGGTIGAESVEGEGSLFWFRLPLPAMTGAHRSGPARDRAALPLQNHRLRILAVEDNEINRMLLAEMLRSLGHDVLCARDGFDGVDKAAGERFDVIFMDISMPGMDGIEAAERIRLDGPNVNTPVIALTAHVGADDQARILGSGFVLVLSKPFTRPDLAGAIAMWVPAGGSETWADPAEEDETDMLSAVLGEQRVAEEISKFLIEIKGFHGEMKAGALAADQVMPQAHHLAGSAAVLGFTSVAECLNRIEDSRGTPGDELLEELQALTDSAAGEKDRRGHA